MYNEQSETGLIEIQVSTLKCLKTAAFWYDRASPSQYAFKFQKKTFPKAKLTTSNVLFSVLFFLNRAN